MTLFFIFNILCGFILIILCIWYFFHIVSMLHGAPYVKSPEASIDFAITALADRKKIADIGSGNGQVLLELASIKNAELHGFEINPLLVLRTWWRIKQAGLQSRVFVHWGNLWNQNFSSFDGVYVYILPAILPRLSKKLTQELPSGALILSAAFPFLDRQPIASTPRAFLYRNERTTP